jgi:hypothetical protein
MTTVLRIRNPNPVPQRPTTTLILRRSPRLQQPSELEDIVDRWSRVEELERIMERQVLDTFGCTLEELVHSKQQQQHQQQVFFPDATQESMMVEVPLVLPPAVQDWVASEEMTASSLCFCHTETSRWGSSSSNDMDMDTVNALEAWIGVM